MVPYPFGWILVKRHIEPCCRIRFGKPYGSDSLIFQSERKNRRIENPGQLTENSTEHLPFPYGFT